MTSNAVLSKDPHTPLQITYYSRQQSGVNINFCKSANIGVVPSPHHSPTLLPTLYCCVIPCNLGRLLRPAKLRAVTCQPVAHWKLAVASDHGACIVTCPSVRVTSAGNQRGRRSCETVRHRAGFQRRSTRTDDSTFRHRARGKPPPAAGFAL